MRQLSPLSRFVLTCLPWLWACDPALDGEDPGIWPPSFVMGAEDASPVVSPVSVPDAAASVPPSDASMSTDAAAPQPDAASDASVAAAASDAAAAADAPSAPAQPQCTGKPGLKRGKSNQTLSAGGARRSFIHYAPKDLDPNAPVPLLIVAHGANMSGQGMFDITQYAKIADREKFVAIFPDGIDGPGSLAPWNVGSGVCGLGGLVASGADDQAFVDALIDFAERDQCIDARHIFMTGFSMGGYFSHESSCVSSKIAAVGPHSAGTHDLSRCPAPPKPTIIFHYTSDSVIGYECGVAARDQLIERNRCSAGAPDVVPVKGGKCEYYKGCSAGQLAMCSFDPPDWSSDAIPSGHGWSGGWNAGAEWFSAIPSTESASELGWAFFKKYAW